jgi:hypothetical protein
MNMHSKTDENGSVKIKKLKFELKTDQFIIFHLKFKI